MRSSRHEEINRCYGNTAAGIIYQSAPGGKVVITGFEPVRGWGKVGGDTWKVTNPNKFFGDFNPYSDEQYREIRARFDHIICDYPGVVFHGVFVGDDGRGICEWEAPDVDIVNCGNVICMVASS